MTIETALALTPLFFGISLVCLMIGIGGGLFYVSLLAAMGVPLAQAAPMSLLCIIFNGSVSSWRFLSRGVADRRAAAAIVIGSAVSATLTGMWAFDTPEDLRLTLFVVYAGWSIVSLLRNRRRANHGAFPTDSVVTSTATAARCAGIGLAAGVGSSFLGVGGGIVIVPMLTSSFRLPLARIMATSASTLSFTALAGVAGYLFSMGGAQFAALLTGTLPLAAASMLGGMVGARLTLGRMQPYLRPAFISVLLILLALLLGKRFLM